MSKSLSKTPAPKSDRIYGSKVNPKGSASSEKSASKIVLSDDIIDGLKNKLSEFKENHTNKNITLNDLKAVYRRGLGAYSSSHRPTISGGKPNSRNAWAMARVNAFLRKAGGGEHKKAYVQDDDLMKYEGGGLLAPNGKQSNLTPEQYKLVRTPEFKAWFGDWENNPEDASKVVDDNGEPLVVYHGTPKGRFNVFDNDKSQDKTFYFTKDKDYAIRYSHDNPNFGRLTDDSYVFEIFLNLRNPLKGYITDFNRYGDSDGADLRDGRYVVLSSNQIKLADGSNTTFDSSNPDIRYKDGGEITNACIEEIVNIINSIQKVKDYFIIDNKLVIVFDEELMVYAMERINYHIGEFKECHDVIDPEANINYRENFKSISFNLKVDDASIGRYKDGGEIDTLIKDGIVELKLHNTTPEHSKEYGFDAKKPLYIQSISVSKEHRLKGIGSKVMQHILDYAKENGNDVIFGHITQQAEPSIDVIKSMFIKEGFNTCEGNNDFYKVMYKDGGEVDKQKFIDDYLKKYDIDKKKTPNRILQGHIKTASKIYAKNILENLPYKKYIVQYKIQAGASFTKEILARTPNEARKEFMMYSDGDKITSIKLSPKQNNYAKGGEVDAHKETYAKWKSLVNMSKSELERFYNSEEGKVAGLKPSEAKAQGIDSGRESARWIMKMKDTKVSDWTPQMWKWANKQISFISRMSGNKGGLYDDKGNKTRKHLSLLIWGNNPEKKNNGGTLPDIRMEDTVGRIDDPRLADISYYKNGGQIGDIVITNEYREFDSEVFNEVEDEILSGFVVKDGNKEIGIVSVEDDIYELGVGYILGLEVFEKNQGYGKKIMKKVFQLHPTQHSFVGKATKTSKPFWLRLGAEFEYDDYDFVLKRDKFILRKGGTINSNNKSNIMEQVKFNELPHIDTINSGDSILIQEDVFSGRFDAPKHIGSRYIHAFVMGKGSMLNSLKLRVIESVGANALRVGTIITRPIANVLTRGRKMLKGNITDSMFKFKEGGLNPDNKEVKQYFAHDSGNAGGVLVGKRHSEGGIKAMNKGTGQPLEMEGGEVVITRGAVSNPKKYDFSGKEMTTREILSKLNVDGGGVSFAEGGDVPDKMNCGCDSYDFGGSTMSIKDFVSRSDAEYQEERLKMGIQKERNDHYATLSRLNAGSITTEQALREIAQKEMKLDSKYPFGE